MITSTLSRNKVYKTNKGVSKRNAMIFYCVMFALPLIQFAIFYIAVNFNSILLAFKQYTIHTDSSGISYITTEWIGFRNFETFFNEFRQPGMWQVILNSVIVFACSLCITIPLNLIFSYYITKKYRWSSFYQVILFLPTIISEITLVALFNVFAQQVLPNVMHMPNFLDFTVNNVFYTCLIYSTFIGFGATTLVYANAMSGIPKSLLEAADIDGATPSRQFFSVVIPCIWPTVVSYIVLAFVGISTNQISLFSFFSNAMGRGFPLDQYNLASWSYFQLMKNSGSQANYPYASAIGLFITLIVAPLSMIINHILLKYGPSEK